MTATIGVFACDDVPSAPSAAALYRSLGRDVAVLNHEADFSEALTIVVGVVSTNASGQRPAFLEFVRLCRLRHSFRGAAVFLSFQPQDRLSRRWSMFAPHVPGSHYVRLPLTRDQLTAALRISPEPLDDRQLTTVVSRHCFVEEDVRQSLHQVINRIGRFRELALRDSRPNALELSELCELISDMANNVGVLGRPDLAAAGRDLAKHLESLSPLAVCDGAGPWAVLVQETIWPNTGGRGSHASPNSSPAGFDSILIIDDDGYPADALAMLMELGYQVSVKRTAKEALNLQAYDPHAVVVCDLTLGNDPTAGERLLAALAQSDQPPLRIALSAAPLTVEIDAAEGVCAGARAKTMLGAKLLHVVICAAVSRRGAAR